MYKIFKELLVSRNAHTRRKQLQFKIIPTVCALKKCLSSSKPSCEERWLQWHYIYMGTRHDICRRRRIPLEDVSIKSTTTT